MGLGESEASIDDGSAIACSICLEIVTGGGDRSTARLLCGHEFHLDCIGSAFNAKGTMQCPNCRKIEKGNWLYANGCRSSPELSFDDWPHAEDLYELYFGTTFGVHWCPFSRVPSLPSSFESDSGLAGSFYSSSLGPPFFPNAHVRDHHRRYHQNPPALHGLPQVGPSPPPPPDPTSYYLFPPLPTSSNRSRHEHQHHHQQDVEVTGNNSNNNFYPWVNRRDHSFTPFRAMPVPVERESGWWGPFPNTSTLSRGRTGDSSYPPPHAGRTRQHYN